MDDPSLLETMEAVPQVPNCYTGGNRMLILLFDDNDTPDRNLDTDSADIPADEHTIFRFTERTPSGLHDPAACPQRNQHRGVRPFGGAREWSWSRFGIGSPRLSGGESEWSWSRFGIGSPLSLLGSTALVVRICSIVYPNPNAAPETWIWILDNNVQQ